MKKVLVTTFKVYALTSAYMFSNGLILIALISVPYFIGMILMNYLIKLKV